MLYGPDIGPALVRHKDTDFVSFTGSSRAGAEIKASSGLRRVALELGGNGPTIVAADASVEASAPVCARNAMRLAGQSCISVQNVYVHESLFEAFVARAVQEVKLLKTGDPLDPQTDVGTLVDEASARRIESWLKEAVAGGAKVLVGGRRTGAQIEPTIMVDVTDQMNIVCNEVFGPVVSIQKFSDFDAVIEKISTSRFGLQCGLFTKSMDLAFKAVRSLRTGGLILNGSSTWRTDQLAYGGIKDSGIGREGPKYAIKDMTDERLVVFNL